MGLITPAIKSRLDSWYNALTGLGGSRDKSTAAEFCPPVHLGQTTLENLYAGDDLARRIVDAYVIDAMREGVVIAGDEDGDVSEEAESLDAWALFQDAGIWGRLHGGGFLLLGVEDGLQDKPLNLETMREGSLKWIMDLDRWSVTPNGFYKDPTQENYGEPETYRVSVPGTLDGKFQGRVVHESRLIRFGGINTSRRRRASNNTYDDSALVPVYDVLRDTNTVWRSGVFAAQDMTQGVFKVKNLVQMIANGQRDPLLQRMEIVDQSRSVARSVVVDADMEDFTTVEGKGLGSFPGVATLTWQRLAAAACMPVTVLMGVSPAGMNATGESDIRLWYDHVAAWREDSLLPQAIRLVEVLARSAGVDPSELVVSFPALWQMSDQEEATYRKTIAETDAIYIDKSVVLPEEVAVSRWGGDEYSAEMDGMDPELRETLAALELEKLEEKASTPDPPPPPSPFGGGPPVPPSGDTEEEPVPEEEPEEEEEE